MPTPEFIRTLREKIGHDALWLSGASAVVLDSEGRVLLTRRPESTEIWSVVSGIIEPGEQPAATAVREVLEETGVVCEAETLVSVHAQEPFTISNGDHVQFLDLTFLCRHVSGVPRVADDENVAVGWFTVEALPPLGRHDPDRIRRALATEARSPAYFEH